MKKTFFLLLISAVLAVGCKKNIESHDVQALVIPSLNTSSIDNKVKVECDIFNLDFPDIVIGTVIDLEYVDSCFYVLDDRGQVVAFPRYASKNPYSMMRVGNGPDEYLQASSISVDRDALYLLDMATNTVKKYDNEFKYLSSIKLDMMSMGMGVYNNTILIGNLDMKAGNYEVIAIDYDGNIAGKFIEGTPELPEYIVSSAHFCHVGDSLAVLPRTVDTFYVWDGSSLSPRYGFEFTDKKSTDQPLTLTMTHCFVIGKSVLLSCIFEGKRIYCIATPETGQVISGRIQKTVDGHPFYPRWNSCDGLLFGYEPAEDGGNGNILIYTMQISD